MDPRTYSSLFSTLYDEVKPHGSLGRGTHYSTLRSVEWRDYSQPFSVGPFIHDFVVVWDEDHDIRVISAIESLYLEGLLSPVLFVGERKGTLSVLVSRSSRDAFSDDDWSKYQQDVGKVSSNQKDSWPSDVGVFSQIAGGPQELDRVHIVNASEDRVYSYLKGIDALWGLGLKSYSQPDRFV